MSFKRFVILLIVLLTFFTRFIGLNWGNGYYFHPDESNMAIALSGLKSADLNPHFFAYGQFPLYLGYFTLKLINVPNDFSNSVFILRFWSALFSVLVIPIIYLISKKIFTSQYSLLVVFLIIFNPGLIQLAHFGTTESMLILIFLLNLFLSQKIFDQPKKYNLYIFAGIFTGIGLASKISSLIFIGPILLVAFVNFLKSSFRSSYILKIFLLIFFTTTFYLILSPYNYLSQSDFLSSLNYETNVATGSLKVFYTTQFLNTSPYLFQFTNIFPYTSGLPVYILAFAGFLLFLKNYKTNHKKYWLSILFPVLVYFTYFGQLYAKWTRFVSPVFFIFPIFAVYLLSKITVPVIRYLLIIICCLPGIYFMNLYLHPDIRLTASRWIFANISSNFQILSESGNVVNLPLGNPAYQINNYDFYNNYDPTTLSVVLASSDYILIPSRRVFKNYHLGYYQHLFDGSLGFKEIKLFTPRSDILLDPEKAEETWSVFDHPTIRIYQKVKQFDKSQYETILKS
jgi:4-amino-4-deoxy-L-arabinose transferase-like glycosyltransferase